MQHNNCPSSQKARTPKKISITKIPHNKDSDHKKRTPRLKYKSLSELYQELNNVIIGSKTGSDNSNTFKA